MSLAPRAPFLTPARLMAIVASPVVAVFVTSNLVNLGNLAFNMIFSRWMGPELFGDLTLLLTIKLAILGILGAVQMSVSQLIAGLDGPEETELREMLARINRRVFVGLWIFVPALGAVFWHQQTAAHMGIGSPYLLLILLVSLPFAAPLSVLRGVIFGKQNTGRIILSANTEMAVRLIGASLAWKAGLGIEGVFMASVMSIIAGWAVLTGVLPKPSIAMPKIRPVATTVALSALPFAVLQLSQVLALDGDIFLVSAMLPAKEAGLVGALSLFQRIEFFACFALASILLPSVVSAARKGGSLFNAVAPVGLLYLAVVIPVLIAVELQPGLLITLLAGDGFLDAAPALMAAAIAAAAFTMSYLLATFLAAIGDRRGIWATITVAVIQLCLTAYIASRPDASFVDLVPVKAACQSALSLCLLIFAIVRVRQHLRARAA